MKEDKKYTPDYCITLYNSIKKQTEETGGHPKYPGYSKEEIIKICEKYI
jgi:hypothetical protein